MADEEQSSDLQSASFSEPFAFRSRLSKIDTRLDFVPVLDIIVIALLVSLLFTSFVALPGVRVDLPVTDMRMQHAKGPVSVLTIGNNGMLFFDGAVFELNSIEKGFQSYVEASERDGLVLLVKADFTMEMQDFLRLCHLAEEAGFVQVQLAGKKKNAAEALVPEAMPGSSDSFTAPLN